MYKISSSSDYKYFSRLINLIGSIKKSNNSKFDFEVWDIGLTALQRWILKENAITVHRVEEFAPHWNNCYSWKLYVYKHSESELFFHLDAGNIVLGDLTYIFEKINNDGYFLIDQGQHLCDITPLEYVSRFNKNVELSELVFAAGNIGLNKLNARVTKAIENAYTAAVQGYCLGYSTSEQHRDINNIGIVRDCKLFRHDQTIINLTLREQMGENLYIHSHGKYASVSVEADTIIYNSRKYNYDYIAHYSSRHSYFLIGYCKILDFYIRCIQKIKGLFGV